MNPFKTGDRVAAYWNDSASRRSTGTVTFCDAETVQIKLDPDHRAGVIIESFFHWKQCRKLRAKRVKLGQTFFIFSTPECHPFVIRSGAMVPDHVKKWDCIEVRQVLR